MENKNKKSMQIKKIKKGRKLFIFSTLLLFIFFLLISLFIPIIPVKVVVYCIIAPCYPISKNVSIFQLIINHYNYILTSLTYFAIILLIIADALIALLINLLISLIYEKFINYKNKRILIKKR